MCPYEVLKCNYVNYYSGTRGSRIGYWPRSHMVEREIDQLSVNC